MCVLLGSRKVVETKLSFYLIGGEFSHESPFMGLRKTQEGAINTKIDSPLLAARTQQESTAFHFNTIATQLHQHSTLFNQIIHQHSQNLLRLIIIYPTTMPIEVAAPIIKASTTTCTPQKEGDEQRWQVFFLPKDDPVIPTSFIAFCPFTGVCAEGGTEAEAASKWKEEARKQFNRYPYFYFKTISIFLASSFPYSYVHFLPFQYYLNPLSFPSLLSIIFDEFKYFYLPEFHTTRKVWYGESAPLNNNLPLSSPSQPPKPSSPSPPSSTTPKSFYVIDNYGDTEQAIAFSPQSKDMIVGKVF